MIPAVQHSAELERILSLPVRRLEDYDGPALSAYLTPYLVTPYGAQTGAKLRPIQAIALWESMHLGGAFCAMPVGAGKTLVSWLLPTVMQARRPLLIIPAKHRKKTEGDFREISRSWVQSRPPMQIRSYSELSVVQHANDLACDCDEPCSCNVGYRPDLIVLDEAHKAKSHLAAVVKRLSRYMRKFPHTRVVVMTGTIHRKSLKDINHLLSWTLKEGAPIPLTRRDLEDWCDALDDKSNPNARTMRPGAILQLSRFMSANDENEAESDDPDAEDDYDAPVDHYELKTARLAFRARLQQTPGVIVTDDSDCDQPLTIDFEVCQEDSILDEAFRNFRTMYVTPDGWPLTDGLSVYRHGTELGCGFYYAWDPRPPDEWLQARKAWALFVREVIQDSQDTARPLDTEGAVALAYAEHPVHREWKAIKPTFEPNSVPVWLSASPMHSVYWWYKRQTEPVLIWVKHREVGRALSQMLGLRYYAAKGCALDERGKPILSEYVRDADKTKSHIVSIDSISDGQNMQAWRRSLVVGMPKAATIVEQMLGREHRSGQDRPVYATILVCSGDTLRAVSGAMSEAQSVRHRLGHTQKILRATIDRSALAGWYEKRSLRWA